VIRPRTKPWDGAASRSPIVVRPPAPVAAGALAIGSCSPASAGVVGRTYSLAAAARTAPDSWTHSSNVVRLEILP